MESTQKVTIKCCIKNCPSVQRKNGKGSQLTFHSFSPISSVYQTWLHNCSNHFNGSFKKSSRICSLHFTVEQYNSSLKTRLLPCGVPTNFPKTSQDADIGHKLEEQLAPNSFKCAEESLKALNSLIKQIDDTNAAINQAIIGEKVDFDNYNHIKKEVDETTILSFEDVSAEESVTNYDSTRKKDINKPTIFTYEEITAEDITDADETFNDERNEVLNNIFKEKFGLENDDGVIKLKIINDEARFKDIQEEIKKEIKEKDIKIETIDYNDKYIKVKEEFQTWNGSSTKDDCYLYNIFKTKEIKSEDLFVEVGIRNEIISDTEDINWTKLPSHSEDTCEERPFLTHISKQNDPVDLEIGSGGTFYGSRSFPLNGVRTENDPGKEICDQPSDHQQISHPKTVCLSVQEAANVKTMKSFERTKYDDHSLPVRNVKNKVSKVSKKNSNSSETCDDPNKNCLIIPVQKKVICIKLKPFKRKMKC